MSTAIEEGLVTESDQFTCGGSLQVGPHTIKCWKHGGHGSQTFLEVVQNSCNPGFVELGNRLGKETLFDYINRFGYGKKTGIDLNGEATGILFSLDKVGPVELATTAFGQGVSVTALQQVVAVSAAINGGTLYKPYIVKRVAYHENGQIIKEVKPTIIRDNIVSKDTIAENTKINVEKIPVEIKCNECGYSGVLGKNNYVCPKCKGIVYEITKGKEFYLDTMEVD